MANLARREGIISLDKELPTIHEPFLRRALMLAVDGTDPEELRKIMELELLTRKNRKKNSPAFRIRRRVFSDIGIIGAVLV